jgi:hypothetical protein
MQGKRSRGMISRTEHAEVFQMETIHTVPVQAPLLLFLGTRTAEIAVPRFSVI